MRTPVRTSLQLSHWAEETAAVRDPDSRPTLLLDRRQLIHESDLVFGSGALSQEVLMRCAVACTPSFSDVLVERLRCRQIKTRLRLTLS